MICSIYINVLFAKFSCENQTFQLKVEIETKRKLPTFEFQTRKLMGSSKVLRLSKQSQWFSILCEKFSFQSHTKAFETQKKSTNVCSEFDEISPFFGIKKCTKTIRTAINNTKCHLHKFHCCRKTSYHIWACSAFARASIIVYEGRTHFDMLLNTCDNCYQTDKNISNYKFNQNAN